MIEKCVYCGHSDIVQKEVQATVNWGVNSVLVPVKAEVCMHCGEHYYSQETARFFDEIRKKLAAGNVDGFRPVGKVFQIA